MKKYIPLPEEIVKVIDSDIQDTEKTDAVVALLEQPCVVPHKIAVSIKNKNSDLIWEMFEETIYSHFFALSKVSFEDLKRIAPYCGKYRERIENEWYEEHGIDDIYEHINTTEKLINNIGYFGSYKEAVKVNAIEIINPNLEEYEQINLICEKYKESRALEREPNNEIIRIIGTGRQEERYIIPEKLKESDFIPEGNTSSFKTQNYSDFKRYGMIKIPETVFDTYVERVLEKRTLSKYQKEECILM